MKTLGIVFVTLVFLALSQSVMAQDCDPLFVNPSAGKLVVSPSGGDDSENLQCALAAARDQRAPQVVLTAGDFEITHVAVENFTGVLAGQGEAETVLNVADSSLDCEGVYDFGVGQTPSALRFVGGQPQVRFLTVHAGRPCMGSPTSQSAQAYVTVHFTGYAHASDCSGADVIFAGVDRVTLMGPGLEEGATYGVAAHPDGLGPVFDRDDCLRPLRGRFDLQRSTISGFRIGARTELDNAGQIVIAANEFDTNRTHILSWFGHQFLTVERNSFSNPAREDGNVGISFQVKAGATGNASIVSNRFGVTSLGMDKAYGVLIGRIHQSRRNPINISANTFTLQGDEAQGMNIDSGASGVVSKNVFRGSGAVGVSLQSPSIATPCVALETEWAIVNNDGFDKLNSAIADIRVICVSGVVVGQGQGADVVADPGNFVLEQ